MNKVFVSGMVSRTIDFNLCQCVGACVNGAFEIRIKIDTIKTKQGGRRKEMCNEKMKDE
jgi:hypothetical protein